MLEEPDYDCYSANFTDPPKEECKVCQYFQRCQAMWEIEIEEMAERVLEEEW